MQNIYPPPQVLVNSYRKTRARCVGIQDPFKSLHRRHHQPFHIDRIRSCGLLMLYCDGNHLYTDRVYYHSLFDGYEHEVYWHSGLQLVPRAVFKKAKYIGVPASPYEGFFLQHNGFTGEPGKRSAKVQFTTLSQGVRPWSFTLTPGTILNLIIDCEDWCLETVWMRFNVKVRRKLLKRSRHLAPSCKAQE